MTWSVCWIVLPNGLAGDALNLSIVVAPAGSALVDWQAVAADLQPRRLVSADGSIELPLTINSTDVRSISHATSSTDTMAADIAEAAGELAELERSMARFSPTAWPTVGERAALAVLGDMVVTRQRGRVRACPDSRSRPGGAQLLVGSLVLLRLVRNTRLARYFRSL